MNEDIETLFHGSSEVSKETFDRLIDKTKSVLLRSFSDDERAFNGRMPEDMKNLLREETFLPRKGIGTDATLDIFEKILLPNALKVFSPYYMAHLHGPPMLASVAAELLLSTTNQSMDSWDQSPMATEIEIHLVNQLCNLYKLPHASDGTFTSGGTQSNLMGVLIARDHYYAEYLNRDVRIEGLGSENGRLRMYASEVAHFSVQKSAALLGLGHRAVRSVPVDKRKKMNADILDQMISEDRAEGLLPFLVIATAGTTDFGSVDPLDRIRTICDKYGLWMHVDAAYGGGLILSEAYRDRISGIEKADSLTIDFHKIFFQSISCGAFLLADGGWFDLISEHADYLNRPEEEEEGYGHLVGKSLQTTRRFDALKVWFSFRSLGSDELARLIDGTIETAAAAYRFLADRPSFEVVIEPEISSVVFRYIGALANEEQVDLANIRIRRLLMHEKGIVIGQTKIGPRTYLKLTLLNPRTDIKVLSRVFTLIEKYGNSKEICA